MLVNSKRKNEKIVLGLLSYTYAEEVEVKNEDLRELLEEYRQEDNLDILLYQDPETNNYVGLLAIERVSLEDEQDQETIYLRRIAIIPSFRHEGLGYRMYLELRQKYPNSLVVGSLSTAAEVSKWNQRYEEQLLNQEVDE